MFCSNCRTELQTGAQVCPSCGLTTRTNPAPLGAPQDPNAIISENPQADVQPVTSLIPLTDGERILWHKEITHGLVHKEVIMEEAVTNKRCLKYDAQSKNFVAQIGITHYPEVVIMNVHRVNVSLGGGVFLTPRMFGLPGLGGFGLYGGPRRGNLKIFGDVSFLSDGKVVMTFENVKDPQGVRQLVEALKRQQGFRGPGRMHPWMGRPFRPMQPWA
ncbi:MAG TPA: zinc ribbon domain-containing protein [Candidatus Dormibacteraeota bacterium]|nr:zinc ribbon domain-containing protein [Candidatus Dormibacteraeota bacterium]